MMTPEQALAVVTEMARRHKAQLLAVDALRAPDLEAIDASLATFRQLVVGFQQLTEDAEAEAALAAEAKAAAEAPPEPEAKPARRRRAADPGGPPLGV